MADMSDGEVDLKIEDDHGFIMPREGRLRGASMIKVEQVEKQELRNKEFKGIERAELIASILKQMED